MGMKQYAAAAGHLAYAVDRVSTDREAWYYAGVAALATISEPIPMGRNAKPM